MDGGIGEGDGGKEAVATDMAKKHDLAVGAFPLTARLIEGYGLERKCHNVLMK